MCLFTSNRYPITIITLSIRVVFKISTTGPSSRSPSGIRQIAYDHLLTLVINAGYIPELLSDHDTTFTTPATPQLSSASSNMINSSKYVFVETKSSWFTGSPYWHSLSFSSDGTTLAGSAWVRVKDDTSLEDDTFLREDDQVQFWETLTGTATWSFGCSLFVVFSPTDPNIAAIVRSGSIHMVKRDSFKGKTWGGQTSYNLNSSSGAVCAFNSNGETIVMSEDDSKKHLREYDPTTSDWSSMGNSEHFVNTITCVVCCPITPNLFAVGDWSGGLDIVSKSNGKLKSLCRRTPVDRAGVSTCAWSQDGKWIATGNAVGDVFLWNAGVPTKVSFAMHLPRTTVTRAFSLTASLIFMQDSAALIIIFGSCLSVWDIYNAEYVANSGLPSMATNIALDGPRNRLAVAVKDRITIYELKLAEEMMCQMDGKLESSEL